MKELKNVSPEKTKVQDVKQVRKKMFLGSLKPHKGHICFEFNLATRTVSVAEFDAVHLDGNTKRILVKPNCVYITALNKANAIKRFRRSMERMRKPAL